MDVVQRAIFVKRVAPLAMQWGVTVYSAAVSLGLSVLFARSMGSSAFGHYTYIYVLAGFLVLVQDAGFNTLLMRERSAPSAVLQSRYAELPSTALLHLTVTTAVFLILTAILYRWLDGPSLAAGIFCFATITLTQWQSSWFKGAGRFERDAVFLFCGRSVSALFVLMCVLSVGAAPVSIFLAWGAGLLVTLVGHYKHFPPLVKIQWKLPTWAYRSSISFFAVGLASSLYHQIDIVLLRNVLGEVPAIGHYAVATRIHDGLMSLATPVVLMLFRRMRALAMDPDADGRFSRNAIAGALGVGVFLALIGWTLGPWLVSVLFGSAYADCTQTIIGLLFTALIFALPNYVLAQNAVATQHERWFAGCLFMAVGVNVLLNLYLIPLNGVLGAAWATILTEFFLSIVLCWGLRSELFK
jgi:O-antigen/teichoic acid export membrane protein